MATAQVGEALAGRRQRRARKGTERRIEQDAERLRLGVSQLLKEAELLGMTGPVRELLLGALRQEEGGPEPERRRTERGLDLAVLRDQTQEAEPAPAPAPPAKFIRSGPAGRRRLEPTRRRG